MCKIKELLEKQIGDVVVCTQKLPKESVDSKVLVLMHRILQAAPPCYDEKTGKERQNQYGTKTLRVKS